jgi:hypothetical protein
MSSANGLKNQHKGDSFENVFERMQNFGREYRPAHTQRG